MKELWWKCFGHKESFRALQAQVQVLQEELHRGTNIKERDESGDKFKEKGHVEHEGVEEGRDPKEDRFFKVISRTRKRLKIEVPTFLGNINTEEMIDWINDVEEYFEYEVIEDL